MNKTQEINDLGYVNLYKNQNVLYRESNLLGVGLVVQKTV